MIEERNTPPQQPVAETAAEMAPIGAGTIETPTRPGAPPARRSAGKAGPTKRRKTAAKRKPGVKVPRTTKAKAAGKFKRASMKTSRVAGKKPGAGQKKGPKKAANLKRSAKTRRTSAGVVRGVTGGRRR